MTLVNGSFYGKLSSLLQEKNIEQIHLLWHLQQVFKVAAQRQKNVGSKIAIIFFLDIAEILFSPVSQDICAVEKQKTKWMCHPYQ